MSNWDDYRIILALDRERTLRGAADRLGVNHSTISRRLASLEKNLGQTLFDKVVGGYRATPEGQEFVASAEQMETIALRTERMGRAREADMSGRMTLSIPEPFGHYLLLDALAEFSSAYPKIDLQILSSTNFVDLDRAEADVVVRATQEPPPHLVGRRLFPYSLSYYCRPGYVESTNREDLRWIASPSGPDLPEWIAGSPYPDAPVGLWISDVELRHRSAIAGYGMTIAACFMADSEPLLQRMTGAIPMPRHDLWVLTHPDLRNTPRVKVLMQVIGDCLRAKRALIVGEI